MSERIAEVFAKNAKGRASMSSVSMTREAASILVSRVEGRTKSRMLAYEWVASHIGRSTTWVRAFIGSGLGSVDRDVGDAIDALLIQELRIDVTRLTHELEIARRSGRHPASREVCEVESHLARARASLDKLLGSG